MPPPYIYPLVVGWRERENLLSVKSLGGGCAVEIEIRGICRTFKYD